MASPGSVAGTSEIEPPSSPYGAAEGRSFMSRAMSDDEDTRMADATPDPIDKHRKKAASKDLPPQIGKIRHLKKDDGDPLWRVDIQHDFLRAVFDNDKKVFSNSYNGSQSDGPKQNFADLYIDAMSRSSKTSRILREKLLSDREAAKGMAMVCLLVNVGRMNTTLNFFPEMRAQLRTYHAIPSLQASQDPHAYKALQDAPRLKSILKGGAEDRNEPQSLELIKQTNWPRTNPVNLIFILCNNATKVAELHFPNMQEFNDLVMKKKYSSHSRAMAFLWLMWFYLESDFTEEGCEENPFGEGVDYNVGVANQGVPRLVEMTEEEIALENVDTPLEVAFGQEKQKLRSKILEVDQAYLVERENKRTSKVKAVFTEDGPAILPRIRPSKHDSDMDSTRSTPPPRAALGRMAALGSARKGGNLRNLVADFSSPAQQPSEGANSRKPRPPTAHQLAVERNRSQRVNYILEGGRVKQHRKSRRSRKQDGAIFRTYRRLQSKSAEPLDDSDEEDEPSDLPIPTLGKQWKFGKTPDPGFREKGIRGLSLMASEPDDFGEEAEAYAAAIRRSKRRMQRWQYDKEEQGGQDRVVAPIKGAKHKSHVPEWADEGVPEYWSDESL